MAKYTKERLQAMSDMQILRSLYELLCFEVHEYEFEGVITIRSGDKVTTAELSPDDIMPLAFEYKLTLMPAVIIDDWGWQAIKNNMLGVSHYYSDNSPLRAIACCLILVLQEQK